MITIDLDEVEARCRPARSEYATYWQQREAASQRALVRALHENRVRDECLEIAMETLGKYFTGETRSTYPATFALAEIKQRLTELKPEEKTE